MPRYLISQSARVSFQTEVIAGNKDTAYAIAVRRFTEHAVYATDIEEAEIKEIEENGCSSPRSKDAQDAGCEDAKAAEDRHAGKGH